MSKADPGRPDPVSLRENVWPGRTALTLHCSSAAVPVRFTITSKPCSRSWLMVVSTDDGPAGAAFASAVSPSAAAVSATAARELRRRFFMVVPFSCACADSVVLQQLRNASVSRVRCDEPSSTPLRFRPVSARYYSVAMLGYLGWCRVSAQVLKSGRVGVAGWRVRRGWWFRSLPWPYRCGFRQCVGKESVARQLRGWMIPHR